jgi:hypothetical protein
VFLANEWLRYSDIAGSYVNLVGMGLLIQSLLTILGFHWSIDLFKKNEKVRKTVCTAADANCLPSILDLDDEPFILAQDEDRLLTQNNINLYQE